MARMVVSHLGGRSHLRYLLRQMRMIGAMCTRECLLSGYIAYALVRVRNRYGQCWYGGVQVACWCVLWFRQPHVSTKKTYVRDTVLVVVVL